MNSKYRYIALFCAFVIVFSTVLSGCSTKKVEFKETTTTGNDMIKIDLDTAEISTNEDGQSFLVDGEGNSVVYDATSTYVIPNNDVVIVPTLPSSSSKSSTTKSTAKKTAKSIITVTDPPTTEPTTSQQKKVYDILAKKRAFDISDNNYIKTDLPEYKVEKLNIDFNSKDNWRISLIKGRYDTNTVGGEVCLYKSTGDGYKRVDDEDRKEISITMWQQINDESYNDSVLPTTRSWWLTNFQNGKLYENSTDSLIMKVTIDFKTAGMCEAFCEALESKGFEYGSTSSYRNKGMYSSDGRSATIVWQ